MRALRESHEILLGVGAAA